MKHTERLSKYSDSTALPPLSAGGEKEEHFHELICASTTAIWDAQLKGDAAAKGSLVKGGFTKRLGGDGTFEVKQPK